MAALFVGARARGRKPLTPAALYCRHELLRDCRVGADPGRRRAATGLQLCPRHSSHALDGAESVVGGDELFACHAAYRHDVRRPPLLLATLAKAAVGRLDPNESAALPEDDLAGDGDH